MQRLRVSSGAWLALGALIGMKLDAIAQETPANSAEQVTVDVIASTPLPGIGIVRDDVPANVQSATADQIARQQSLDLSAYLSSSVASVFVNASQSNPFQPDVLFRGFTASPLLGSPIGMSVFVDGVRVNESFGDTVLWDLIPRNAISTVNLIPGSNPVFGLNTLGGVLAVQTKSGRYFPGLSAEVTGASWGRREVDVSYGGKYGDWDGFISGNLFDENGWRDRSPSRVRQLFAKVGWETATTDVDISLTHAQNQLTGNGLAPESMLRRRRAAIYTWPDRTKPDLDFLNLVWSHRFARRGVLTGNIYRRALELGTFNGDIADEATVDSDAINHTSSTTQRTFGAAIQLALAADRGQAHNQFTAGLSFDHGKAQFRQFDQAADFNDSRGTVGRGPLELITRLEGANRYLGLYVSDTFAPFDALHLTASARYSHARISTNDLTGVAAELNGQQAFGRVSPSLGITYKSTPATTLYLTLNEGFRVPTPVESTCADPEAPCALPVGFISDPPLRPVIARTVEMGARGRRGEPLGWYVTAYRTTLKDDLLFTAVGRSQGFFANVPRTQRQGFEGGLAFNTERYSVRIDAAEVHATYESDIRLFNPISDEADLAQPQTIQVSPGDSLPGIPRRVVKLTADWNATPALSIGISAQAWSSQYLRGDEGNTRPPLGGATVVEFRAGYALNQAWSLSLQVSNLFNREFASVGSFARNSFDANNELVDGPGVVERFLSPAAPRSLSLGLTYRMGGRHEAAASEAGER